jgi:hypothetical protein
MRQMPHGRYGGKHNDDGKQAGKHRDNIARVHDTYSHQNSFSQAQPFHVCRCASSKAQSQRNLSARLGRPAPMARQADVAPTYGCACRFTDTRAWFNKPRLTRLKYSHRHLIPACAEPPKLAGGLFSRKIEKRTSLAICRAGGQIRRASERSARKRHLPAGTPSLRDTKGAVAKHGHRWHLKTCRKSEVSDATVCNGQRVRDLVICGSRFNRRSDHQG